MVFPMKTHFFPKTGQARYAAAQKTGRNAGGRKRYHHNEQI